MKRSARVRFTQPDLPAFYVEGEAFVASPVVADPSSLYAQVTVSSPRTNEQRIGHERVIDLQKVRSTRTGKYVQRYDVEQRRYGRVSKRHARLGDALLDLLHDEVTIEADRVRVEAARIMAVQFVRTMRPVWVHTDTYGTVELFDSKESAERYRDAGHPEHQRFPIREQRVNA